MMGGRPAISELLPTTAARLTYFQVTALYKGGYDTSTGLAGVSFLEDSKALARGTRAILLQI